MLPGLSMWSARKALTVGSMTRFFLSYPVGPPPPPPPRRRRVPMTRTRSGGGASGVFYGQLRRQDERVKKGLVAGVVAYFRCSFVTVTHSKAARGAYFTDVDVELCTRPLSRRSAAPPAAPMVGGGAPSTTMAPCNTIGQLFLCSICPYIGFSQRALREHVSVRHTSEKRFKCAATSECCLCFKTSSALRKHLKRRHQP